MRDIDYSSNKLKEITNIEEDNGNLIFTEEVLRAIIKSINSLKEMNDAFYRENENIQNGFNVNAILKEIDKNPVFYKDKLPYAWAWNLAYCGVVGEVKNFIIPMNWINELDNQNLTPDNWIRMNGQPLTVPSWLKTNIDARGCFLRNIDQGSRRDSDGSREPGNYQEDTFKSHEHYIDNRLEYYDYNQSIRVTNTRAGGGPSSYDYVESIKNRLDNDKRSVDFKGYTNYSGSEENRPKNISVFMVHKIRAYPSNNWINKIKAKLRDMNENE